MNRMANKNHIRRARLNSERSSSNENKDLGQRSAKRNSIVFQSQIKSIHNYFYFLQNIFGRNLQIKKVIHNLPHKSSIRRQYTNAIKRRISTEDTPNVSHLFSQTKLMTQPVQFDKQRFASTHRVPAKCFQLNPQTQQLKSKFQNSLRTKHSFLMQKIQKSQSNTYTAPIFCRKNNKINKNALIPSLGEIQIQSKLSFKKTNKTIQQFTYPKKSHTCQKKKRLKLRIPMSGSEVKRIMKETPPLDQSSGPWKIIDSQEYNPRSYYLTYR